METIAAIATGQQMSAISIIRLSGDDAFSIVNQIFSKNIMDKPSHTIHYGYIRDPYTNQIIDEVLVNLYRAPKTFTKEDVVEINCHGGLFVTNQVLTLVLAQGARLATPGEFTKRAFLNGRLDLTQAEAIEDLLEANNHDQLNLAMHGLRGSVKKLMDPFVDSLVQIISNIEVNIDYPEYDDVEVLTNEKIIPLTKQ